jgi:hypothetical protein
VEDEKMVRITYHLGVTAEEELKSIPVEQVIIPTGKVDAWLSQDGK